MEPTYISWTPTNWITVFLMAFGGFVIAKALSTGFKKLRANSGGVSA